MKPLNVYQEHDIFLDRYYRRQRLTRRLWWIGLIICGIIGAFIGAWFGKG